jgi:hypothetical protein
VKSANDIDNCKSFQAPAIVSLSATTTSIPPTHCYRALFLSLSQYTSREEIEAEEEKGESKGECSRLHPWSVTHGGLTGIFFHYSQLRMTTLPSTE